MFKQEDKGKYDDFYAKTYKGVRVGIGVINMIVKVNPEKFMQIAFAGQKKMDIKMSSACRGGGGCYQCKCSPRKKDVK